MKTATKTATRAQVNLYLIETDNGDGRYARKLTFRRLEGKVVNVMSRSHDNLVDRQELDGGLYATVTAPAGAEMVETESGELALSVPGYSWPIGANEAYAIACDQANPTGFGLLRRPVEMIIAD